MNRQEAIKRMQALEKELAELKKIIEAPEVSPEERFLQLVENVEIRRDLERYPNSIFFFDGDKFLAEYDARFPENLCISRGIWDVFANEYKMKYVEIQAFMREQVEKYFKMKVRRPIAWFTCETLQVEEHFKMKAREN